MLDFNYLLKKVDIDMNNIVKKQNDIDIFVKNDAPQGFITGDSIYELLKKCKYLLTINPKMKNLRITIDGKLFGDDAVILYLELIVMMLFDYGFKNVFLFMPRFNKNSITWVLYEMSVLYKSIKRDGLINRKNFMAYYDRMRVNNRTDFNYRVGLVHTDVLRLIVENDNCKESASRVGTLVYDYLLDRNEHGKMLFSEEYIEAAVNIVVEIIDNTLCHTKSDCVFSMKVCDYTTVENRSFMLSIVLSNFDDTLISSYIDEGLKNGSLRHKTKEKIEKAYEYHKEHFNDIYDYDCFTLVSAFQRGVTTRENATNDSGRGLTTFLKSLLVASQFHSCYVYSGNNLLYFQDDKIRANSDGFIGFNTSGKYIDDVPDNDIFCKMDYYNSGTLYNLMLIYDREDKENGRN